MSAQSVAVLLATLTLGACGGIGPEPRGRALSDREYQAVAKRACLAAKQSAADAARTSAAPAVYLRRGAEAAESIRDDLARVRPPARFVAVHRESLRLGRDQLGLIRAALTSLQTGATAAEVRALEVRSRRLLRRSDEIADEIGVPECVNEPAGS